MEQTQPANILYDEEAKSNYTSFDYVIIRQLQKVAEYSNETHFSHAKHAFINSVKTLHQIAQYYWMFDEEYKESYKALINWRKEVLETLIPGTDTIQVDKPMLFLDIQEIAESDGAKYFALQMHNEGNVQMSVLEFDELFSRLNLHILMTVITKKQKQLSIQDIVE